MRLRLRQEHEGDASTRVVEEMGIWSSSVRIDIAVINGELSGFELKSDRDTLQRLPLQADIYSRVFDRLALVVGSRHTAKALPIIPSWWSIIEAKEANGTVILETVRTGTPNPNPDPLLVAKLLWKNEALAALESFGLAKGWRSKRISALHHRLATELSLVDLGIVVRAALKGRDGWLRQN